MPIYVMGSPQSATEFHRGEINKTQISADQRKYLIRENLR